MKIRQATIKDAPLLGQVVIWGIGEEITDEFAGPCHTGEDVKSLFTILAEREDSQYSFKNALVAEAEDGTPMGAIIGYDGARLYDLRKAFLRKPRAGLITTLKVKYLTKHLPTSSILIRWPSYPNIAAKGLPRPS